METNYKKGNISFSVILMKEVDRKKSAPFAVSREEAPGGSRGTTGGSAVSTTEATVMILLKLDN